MLTPPPFGRFPHFGTFFFLWFPLVEGVLDSFDTRLRWSSLLWFFKTIITAAKLFLFTWKHQAGLVINSTFQILGIQTCVTMLLWGKNNTIEKMKSWNWKSLRIKLLIHQWILDFYFLFFKNNDYKTWSSVSNSSFKLSLGTIIFGLKKFESKKNLRSVRLG